jgi:hypothetical protein
MWATSDAKRPLPPAWRQERPMKPEGLERSRRANWKHGYYSAKAKQERREARNEMSTLRELLKKLQAEGTRRKLL